MDKRSLVLTHLVLELFSLSVDWASAALRALVGTEAKSDILSTKQNSMVKGERG